MSGKSRLETFTTEESGMWMQTLEEIGAYDFYHLPSYHKLAETRGEGQAVMPVYRQGNHLIAFPMLLREIEIPQVPNDLKDATSVSGFAGPVASGNVPDDVREDFLAALQDYYIQNNIISAFSRLNPLITQDHILGNSGEIIERGVTVSIDLTPSPEAQFLRYRDNYRTEIRRLIKMGFRCEKVGADYLDEFLCIYQETMDRAGAEDIYYFDRSYCEYLMREMPHVVSLIACLYEDSVACIALNSLCCGVIEGLYSGTAAQYRKLSPSKFLYDEIRRWGCEMGAHTYHLGGGVGAQKDSLYEFKMGFGGREHVYSTWRYIADPKTYDELCRELSGQAGMEPEEAYFPVYRHPDLQPVSGG